MSQSTFLEQIILLHFDTFAYWLQWKIPAPKSTNEDNYKQKLCIVTQGYYFMIG